MGRAATLWSPGAGLGRPCVLLLVPLLLAPHSMPCGTSTVVGQLWQCLCTPPVVQQPEDVVQIRTWCEGPGPDPTEHTEHTEQTEQHTEHACKHAAKHGTPCHDLQVLSEEDKYRAALLLAVREKQRLAEEVRGELAAARAASTAAQQEAARQVGDLGGLLLE